MIDYCIAEGYQNIYRPLFGPKILKADMLTPDFFDIISTDDAFANAFDLNDNFSAFSANNASGPSIFNEG